MAPFSNVTYPYIFIWISPTIFIMESSIKSRYESRQCKNLLKPVCNLLSTPSLFLLKNTSELHKENSKCSAENLQTRGILLNSPIVERFYWILLDVLSINLIFKFKKCI